MTAECDARAVVLWHQTRADGLRANDAAVRLHRGPVGGENIVNNAAKSSKIKL